MRCPYLTVPHYSMHDGKRIRTRKSLFLSHAGLYLVIEGRSLKSPETKLLAVHDISHNRAQRIANYEGG